MRARLIYNPNAGNSDDLKPEEVIKALRLAGYQTEYQETSKEEDLDKVLQNERGLIVVMGGDGSLRAVARRMVGRRPKIALIPMGTANNIARAMDITGEPLEVIERLRHPIKRRFDMGCVRTPFANTFFLEAFGYGYFASGLAAYNPEEGKSILRSLKAMAETITTFKTEQCKLMLDHKDISGEYLMVAAMNTPAFGPRLKFNPNGDPGDGWMEVVRINKENSDNLVSYINSLLNEEFDQLPSVETQRGRRLDLVWSGTYPMHADAEVIPAVREEDKPGLFPVSVEIIPRAFELWMPSRPPEDGKEKK